MMPPYKGYKGYTAQRVTFPLLAGSLQIGIITLFVLYCRYDSKLLPEKLGSGSLEQPVNEYATFQDVHVMIFAGFGFLMTFLRRYGYSGIGVNFVLAAFCIQWATLCHGFLHLDADGHFSVNLRSMLTADFAAATVLVSFGAVLGKASPTQLIIMALVEIICAQLNEYVGSYKLRVTDAGKSLFVHAFGAYFGMAVSRVLHRDDIHFGDAEGTNYHSDIFAMIGTIFLWLFWPSFNAGALVGAEQNRAFLNTYFSLASCCLVAFIVSWLCDGRFNMVHIQNSTLAGGVAIGTAADLLVKPHGALVIGGIGAIISLMGYKLLTPKLNRTLKIHDTCGVHNLHGMPGILAGFIGAFMASSASLEKYGLVLFEKFPARLPDAYYSVTYNNTIKQFGPGAVPKLNALMESEGFGSNRSAPQQAAQQFLAIIVTLLAAIVSGTITGFILRLPVFHNIPRKRMFEDEVLWEVADFAIRSTDQKGAPSQEDNFKSAQGTELKEVETPLLTKEGNATTKTIAESIFPLPRATRSEAATPKAVVQVEVIKEKEVTAPPVS